MPLAAQAQVTLFGVFDLGYKDDGSTFKMASGQWAGPRVGVRGSNDIGGGLKANFHVESAIGYLGTANWDTSRGAFGGLSGGFGRIDFGSRILSPSFWAAAAIDPTGQSGLTITPYGGIGARIDKAAYYTSNSLSGLVVRAAVQMSDDNGGNSGFDASGVYTAGPLAVAVAFGDNGTKDGMSLGVSYNLKVANVRVRYIDSELNNAEAFVIGATVPFGKTTAFIDFLKDESAAKVDKTLVGVSHELGKNTWVYGYHKGEDNKDDVIGVGLRHAF
jgi:predicted porin